MPEPGEYENDGIDPYIDPQTGILRNIPGLLTQNELDAYEATVFQANSLTIDEAVAPATIFTLDVWRDLHRHCFSDIYDWAGNIREQVRISKENTAFCYPENIIPESVRLFEFMNDALSHQSIDGLAEAFGELNVLHPFREGNGRTQRILFQRALSQMGYDLGYEQTLQAEWIEALIHAYHGNSDPIKLLFRRICTRIE